MKKLPWFLLCLVLTLFLLIQVKGLTGRYPGDEHAYYAMASLMDAGKLPYQDFFVSQPPLQLWLLSLLISLFGFSIVALKLVPLLAIIGSAVFLYLTAKQRFGWKAGLLSVAGFLFSFEVLSKGTFGFGVHLAVLFMSGAYYLYIRDKFAWSGVLFGIAGMVRFYVIIPALVIGICLLVQKRNVLLRFFGGFSAAFLLPNLVLISLFKEAYLTPVIAYHFMKVRALDSTVGVIGNVLSENWILFVPLIMLAFLQERASLRVPLFILLGYLVFVLQSKRVFEYYFIPLFYFVALLAGGMVALALRQRNVVRHLGIVFLVLALWVSISHVLFVQKIILGPFSVGDEIVDYIEERASEESVLLGDASMVPLVHLLTGMPIADNLIDTNGMVFSSGVLDSFTVLDTLRAEKDVFVIARPGQSIGSQPIIVEYLKQQCNLLTFYEDRVEGQFFLYRCQNLDEL